MFGLTDDMDNSLYEIVIGYYILYIVFREMIYRYLSSRNDATQIRRGAVGGSRCKSGQVLQETLAGIGGSNGSRVVAYSS